MKSAVNAGDARSAAALVGALLVQGCVCIGPAPVDQPLGAIEPASREPVCWIVDNRAPDTEAAPRWRRIRQRTGNP